MTGTALEIAKPQSVLFMLNQIPGHSFQDHRAGFHNYDSNAHIFSDIAGLEKIIIFPRIQEVFNRSVIHGKFDRSKDRILDLGCGPFLIARPFLRDGIAVDGIDSSRNMLQVAKKTLSESNLNISFSSKLEEIRTVGDLPNAEYGFAMMNFVHQCCPTRDALEKLFEVAYRALKPGSTLYITGAHPDFLDRPHSLCEYDIDDVRQLEEGASYTGKIFHQDGRSYIFHGDYFWKLESLKQAARKAGFEYHDGNTHNIADIEPLSATRVPSQEPAYFGMSVTKPYPRPEAANNN